MRKLWLLCLIFIIAVPCWPQTHTVALTFDDLPLAGSLERLTPTERLPETRAVNRAILKSLRQYHAPATAFVNEGKVVADGHTKANRAILREWTKHGNELGNHTYSHADLDKLTAEQFEKEIVDGDPSVRSLMSEKKQTAALFPLPVQSHRRDSSKARCNCGVPART